MWSREVPKKRETDIKSSQPFSDIRKQTLKVSRNNEKVDMNHII